MTLSKFDVTELLDAIRAGGDIDEIAVRRHIVPALGARPVGSLTPDDVQKLVNKWTAQRAPRTVRRTAGSCERS